MGFGSWVIRSAYVLATYRLHSLLWHEAESRVVDGMLDDNIALDETG